MRAESVRKRLRAIRGSRLRWFAARIGVEVAVAELDKLLCGVWFDPGKSCLAAASSASSASLAGEAQWSRYWTRLGLGNRRSVRAGALDRAQESIYPSEEQRATARLWRGYGRLLLLAFSFRASLPRHCSYRYVHRMFLHFALLLHVCSQLTHTLTGPHFRPSHGNSQLCS